MSSVIAETRRVPTQQMNIFHVLTLLITVKDYAAYYTVVYVNEYFQYSTELCSRYGCFSVYSYVRFNALPYSFSIFSKNVNIHRYSPYWYS